MVAPEGQARRLEADAGSRLEGRGGLGCEVAYYLGGEIVGHLLDFIDGAHRQRTWDDDDARAGHAQRGDPGIGRAGEGAGYNADGRNTLAFGCYCVVETPRRAGASIGNPVDHRVTFLGKRVQCLLGAGGAIGELGGVHDLFSAVVVDQYVLQFL